jgi:hypothetical protein
MRLNKITFTGIDDSVDFNNLIALSAEFPFIEFGQLFSLNKMGTSRYPSTDWCHKEGSILEKILEKKESEIPHLSAHLCGYLPRAIMINGVDLFEGTLKEAFKRIQLNFNAMEYTNYKFTNLFNFLSENKEIDIIIQANKSNEIFISDVLESLKDAPAFKNLNILYDTSLGRGTFIKEYKEPFAGIYTGYAGGIGPDNVKEVLDNIMELKSDANFWIDMESGLRTMKENSDIFDLDKVTKVIEICKQYM